MLSEQIREIEDKISGVDMEIMEMEDFIKAKKSEKAILNRTLKSLRTAEEKLGELA